MSTQLYFALHNTPMANDMTFGQWNWSERPLNVLCSFALKGALKSWKGRHYETPGVKTILDSGAFSAWKTGTPVSPTEFYDEAASLLNEDWKPESGEIPIPYWDEVASLDVIGDHSSSLQNALHLQEFFLYTAQGHKCLPTFHYGEPWELLSIYKEKFHNRVALGGIATGLSSTQKMKWLGQCFARAYPCKFHGFGVGAKEVLIEFPFVSADTASWGAVHMYGRSQAVPGLKIPKLGDGQREAHYDLRYEIKSYLAMEAEVQDRWEKELLWAST